MAVAETMGVASGHHGGGIGALVGFGSGISVASSGQGKCGGALKDGCGDCPLGGDSVCVGVLLLVPAVLRLKRRLSIGLSILSAFPHHLGHTRHSASMISCCS